MKSLTKSFQRNRLLSDLKKEEEKRNRSWNTSYVSTEENERVGPRGAVRREISDEGRIGSGRGSGSARLASLFSPPLLAFPRLSSILREGVRAAGAYSGICSEIYVRMERSRAVPRAASILLPPIYNFSCAHLRQLSDARERAPTLQTRRLHSSSRRVPSMR